MIGLFISYNPIDIYTVCKSIKLHVYRVDEESNLKVRDRKVHRHIERDREKERQKGR